MKNSCMASISLLSALCLVGCGNSEAPASKSTSAPDVGAKPQVSVAGPIATGSEGLGSGKVLETMDAGKYTYVKINVNGRDLWAAGPATQVKVGDSISLPMGQAMQNFHSKTLDRTFETIYFVPSILTGSEPVTASNPHGMMGMHPASTPAVAVSGIAKADGGQTIGEIYQNKASLSQHEVLVRGKVIKFNAQIMGKNWLHIQDGTGEADANDLTVTTQDTVAVGDTVLVRGTLATDKDFGAGYAYDIIVEQAKVTKE